LHAGLPAVSRTVCLKPPGLALREIEKVSCIDLSALSMHREAVLADRSVAALVKISRPLDRNDGG